MYTMFFLMYIYIKISIYRHVHTHKHAQWHNMHKYICKNVELFLVENKQKISIDLHFDLEGQFPEKLEAYVYTISLIFSSNTDYFHFQERMQQIVDHYVFLLFAIFIPSVKFFTGLTLNVITYPLQRNEIVSMIFDTFSLFFASSSKLKTLKTKNLSISS